MCPHNYNEEEMRSLKWMLTPKHKEITCNKLETTEVHSCGGEPTIPMATIIQ